MSSKPTIVVVPGSWHVPKHFEPTTKVLTAMGYKVVGVRTPSIRNSGPYPPGFSADAAAVDSAILEEVDAGNDVVVVMHSYGGVCGSMGVHGHGKKERAAKGLPGGVTQLIYLCAIVLEAGQTVWGLWGKKSTEKGDGEWIEVLNNEKTLPDDPIEHFYGDVPEELRKKAVSMLQPQAMGVNTEEQKYEPYKEIPSTYVICDDDRAIPLQVQEMFASKPGGLWNVIRMGKVSHSPFLSKPDETGAIIDKVASAA